MSYSNSEKSIKKVERFLNSLASTKGDSVAWTTNDPSNLAYQIRQGLTIAEKNSDKYPEFAKLKLTFKIEVKQNRVIAVRHVPLIDNEETIINVNGFMKSVATFEVPEVRDVMGVVGALIENPHFDEYSFKDYTEPSEVELSRIFKYTSKHSLFIVKSKNLIITKREPPEELSWRPTSM